MTEKEQTKEEKRLAEGPRSFAVFLGQIDEGSFQSELSATLQKLSAQLGDYATATCGLAKGAMTITLAFTTEPTGTVTVEAGLKIKEPQARRPRSVFWLTGGANLSPDNPRQQRLPLREVAVAAERARELPASEASVRSV